jgi:predicted transcriptional regulator
MLKKLNEDLDLLIRHLEIAKTIAENEPTTASKLEKLMGISRNQVRCSLHALEQHGYIRISGKGEIKAVWTQEKNDQLGVDVVEFVWKILMTGYPDIEENRKKGIALILLIRKIAAAAVEILEEKKKI